MGLYNSVQIGTIHLTDDGTASGLPCRTKIENLDAFIASRSGAVRFAANGRPYLYYMPNLKRGAPLRIIIETISNTVFNSLLTAINNALSTESTISITISGEAGTWTVNAHPLLSRPVKWASEQDSPYLHNVIFEFAIIN
jgi:hypothetical protein